jgi:hypothetical protein
MISQPFYSGQIVIFFWLPAKPSIRTILTKNRSVFSCIICQPITFIMV